MVGCGYGSGLVLVGKSRMGRERERDRATEGERERGREGERKREREREGGREGEGGRGREREGRGGEREAVEEAHSSLHMVYGVECHVIPYIYII